MIDVSCASRWSSAILTEVQQSDRHLVRAIPVTHLQDDSWKHAGLSLDCRVSETLVAHIPFLVWQTYQSEKKASRPNPSLVCHWHMA